jgi:LiaI-LiaF-like transmembrane region
MAPEVASENNQYETRHKHRPEKASLMGPIILVALGVMFLVGQFVPGWGVSKTWPFLLIVIGITKLLESVLSRGSTPPE